MSSSSSQSTVLRIRPSSRWSAPDFGELWRYRDMIWFFTLRNLKTRYKQTLLGPVWVVVMPLFSAGIFSLVFGGLANLPSGALPYPVLAFSGILIWTLFSRAFSASSGSLVANQHIISKVYFPRLIAPITGSINGLIDFALGFVFLIVMMIIAGITPTWAILTLPLFVLLAVVTGISLGLWIAAISIRVRDLRYAGSFITQIGMWLTPVAYSSELVFDNQEIPEHLRPVVETLFQLNPMFVVVEGFRWSMLGHPFGQPQPLTLVPVLLLGVILIGGLFLFKRIDGIVADVV